MIQSGFVKLERVLLPYAQDAAHAPVCEHLKEQKVSDYSLTEGESPVSQQACQSRARDGREKRVSPSTKNVASRSKQNAHLSPFPRNFHPSSPDFTPDRQALVVGLSPTQPKYFILLTRRCDVKRQSGFSKLSFRRDGRDPSFLCAKLM